MSIFYNPNPQEEAQKASEQLQMQQARPMQGGGGGGPGLGQQLAVKAGTTAATSAFGPMGGAIAGPILGSLFNNGTAGVGVPEPDFGPDPFATPAPQQMYNNGTGYARAMQYAQGTDSVPAMLTPGEAVIPAGAAQDPMNQQAIQGMLAQGQAMNQGMPAPSPMGDPMGMPMGGPMGQPMEQPMHAMPSGEMMPGAQHMGEEAMPGPLSGKTMREETKLLQDMSLKKKAWEAEEQRKQELHNQKMRLMDDKARQSMKQAQE